MKNRRYYTKRNAEVGCRHCFPLFLFIPQFHVTFHGFGILYKEYSLLCILHNPVPCRKATGRRTQFGNADGLLGDAHDAAHVLIFHAHFVEDEEEGVLCWQSDQRSSGGRSWDGISSGGGCRRSFLLVLTQVNHTFVYVLSLKAHLFISILSDNWQNPLLFK